MSNEDRDYERWVANQENVEATHRITLREVQRETMRVQTENDKLREQLGDLLALIHRDGGHHQDDVGTEQALVDAKNVLLDWRQSHDELAASQKQNVMLEIAEKFSHLLKDCDGWYRGSIDYKVEGGKVTRIDELKITLTGEEVPVEFFHLPTLQFEEPLRVTLINGEQVEVPVATMTPEEFYRKTKG